MDFDQAYCKPHPFPDRLFPSHGLPTPSSHYHRRLFFDTCTTSVATINQGRLIRHTKFTYEYLEQLIQGDL